MTWTSLLANKEAQKHKTSKKELDNMRALIARDARRQHAAREIIRRTVLGGKKKLSTEQQNLTADVLSMLTSFESYDALARAGHTQGAILATLTRMALAAIGSAD